MMVMKSVSLVEQKRLQWAKEREELAGLGALWGTSAYGDDYRSCIRTHYVSSAELRQAKHNYPDASYERVTMLTRSPSLPPISTGSLEEDADDSAAQRTTTTQRTRRHEDAHSNEGETSGYNSESNEWSQQQRELWEKSHHRDERTTSKKPAKRSEWPPRDDRQRFFSPESLTSAPAYNLWTAATADDANRLKWGDRGVGVGHLWEPAYLEPECRLPQMEGMGRVTPGWLERGLTKLDASQLAQASAPPDGGGGGGLSKRLAVSNDALSVKSSDDRSYIRGQNVPLDPQVLLEREVKRQKALEHQNAIRQQLEERDRKRKADIEKRIREERQEEERIRKEREREKQRYDEEQKKKKEKEEKESQKALAMREALQNADKQAREEKSRASRKHALQTSVVEFPKDIECAACVSATPPDDANWYQDKSTTSEDEPVAAAATAAATAKRIGARKTEDNGRKMGKDSKGKSGAVGEIDERLKDGLKIMNDKKAKESVVTREKHVDVQPTVMLLSPVPNSMEQRVLTPSKFRRPIRECATQTDAEMERDARKKARKVKMKEREKSASLERASRERHRPDYHRSKSQPRVSLEDRPKWGVNRPDTQYRKQSEKDPYYQRKLRRRQSEQRVAVQDTGTDTDTYTSRRPGRYNSDDYSRSPSPPPRSHPRKHRNQHRKKHSKHSKSFGQKAERFQDSPVLSPIESYDEDYSPPMRRNVVEERQLPEHIGPDYFVTGKRLLNREMESPLTIEATNDKYLDQWAGDNNILSQLTLLRNGLLMKQQEWDQTRSHTSFSESSWYSNT